MLLAAVASLAISYTPALQSPPEKVVFVSDRDGNDEIYSMSIDGSNLKRLTNDKAGDRQPCWSPDGKRIVWSSNRGGKNWDIWVMNADGTDQQNLTDDRDKYQNTNPMWSKSENTIAFISERRFYSVSPDGQNFYERPGLLPVDCQYGLSPIALRFCLRDQSGRILIREGVEIGFIVMISYGRNGVPSQACHPSYSSDAANIIFDSGGATPKIYTIDLRDTTCDPVVMDGFGFEPVFAKQDTAALFTYMKADGKGTDIGLIDLDASSKTHEPPKPINLTGGVGNNREPNYWEPTEPR